MNAPCRQRNSNASSSRSWIKYIKRQPCTPMYGRLYDYAGNNPVRYMDPNGNWILDWRNGQWIAEEGDTLWGKFGKHWKEKTGYTGDPTKLQIGERVGPVRWETYSSKSGKGVHINFFKDKWVEADEIDSEGNHLSTNIHIAAEKITREPNTFYIGAHGFPDEIIDANRRGVPFEDLLEAIWYNPDFEPGMNIILLSCNTGNNSSGSCLAMKLAEEFVGSTVMAPNDYLMMDSTEGLYWVNNNGEFKAWLYEWVDE